jgi:TRAP transporter TAXI family solute receptor
MWVALYPHTTVVENETARPMRALSFDADKLQTYLDEHGGGFEMMTLPVGIYGGQSEPAQTVGTTTFLFASEEMSDDVAYRVVKTIWNNLPRFKQAHSLLSYMEADTVGRGMIVPIHPGAKKFFDERSIPYVESKLN